MSCVLAQLSLPAARHSMASTMRLSKMGPLNSVPCAMAYSTAVKRNTGREPTRHARTRDGLSGCFSRSAAQSRSNASARAALSISGRRHRSSGSSLRTCPREMRGETCENASASRAFGVCHCTGAASLSSLATSFSSFAGGFFSAAVPAGASSRDTSADEATREEESPESKLSRADGVDIAPRTAHGRVFSRRVAMSARRKREGRTRAGASACRDGRGRGGASPSERAARSVAGRGVTGTHVRSRDCVGLEVDDARERPPLTQSERRATWRRQDQVRGA